MRNLIAKIVTVAGLFGVDVWAVWAYVQSLRASTPLRLIGPAELHPPFFLLLACVAVPVSVAVGAVLFWSQARRLVPHNRFHDLAPEARALYSALMHVGGRWPEISEHGDLVERILTLTRRLNRLSIIVPKVNERAEWMFWLPLIASWAETRSLRIARRAKLPESN